MLLTVFSVPAKADEVVIPDYHVYATAKVKSSAMSSIASLILGSVYPWKNTEQTIYKELSLAGITNHNQITANQFTITYAPDNAELPLFNKTGYYRITLSNIRASVFIGSTGYTIPKNIMTVVQFTDGKSTIAGATMVGTTAPFDLQFDIDLDKPIKQIVLTFVYEFNSETVDGFYKPVVQVKDKNDFAIAYQELDKKVGLLESVITGVGDVISGLGEIGTKLTSGFTNVITSLSIGFGEVVTNISNVFTQVKNGFSSMVSYFKEIVSGISNLPAKIWSAIESGLVKVFVPDEDYLAEFREDLDIFLAEKFGAVYQVVDVLFTLLDKVNESDVTNTITCPQATIPLPDNNSFTFGGFEVLIVPSGFEFLAEACKLASGIYMTLLFVNGLRSRYDELMGVVS